ncbi:hypothetical protein BH11MYX4_BH11MYX4_46450 [soil metagenome]
MLFGLAVASLKEHTLLADSKKNAVLAARPGERR